MQATCSRFEAAVRRWALTRTLPAQTPECEPIHPCRSARLAKFAPKATTAPDLLEEPPEIESGFHALRQSPQAALCPETPSANSATLRAPSWIEPATSRRCNTEALRKAATGWRALEPKVAAYPVRLGMSLYDIGIPSSGASGLRPCRLASSSNASTNSAARSAPSFSRLKKQCVLASARSALSSAARMRLMLRGSPAMSRSEVETRSVLSKSLARRESTSFDKGPGDGDASDSGLGN